MKKLYTEKDIEALLAGGGSAADIPAGALLTPSAKDRLRDLGSKAPVAAPKAQSTSAPGIPDHEYHWTPGGDPATPQAIQQFFNSPEIERIKQHMVDIGRRIWERDYVDGNGGNLTVRVGDNLVLCTPTLISKGFMRAQDIALIDLDGNQLAGPLKRTSEAMTHLGIMKRQPKAKACCHAHPPHGTAFAVASVVPPTCMIPEAEVFLGQIGLAPYRTPGTPENADVVGEMGVEHQAVLMENHGVITWGKDIEDAYWKMENVDAYCKTVWVASQLGAPLKQISGSQAKELIDLRKTLGMDDPREGLKECELCDNSGFTPGVQCVVPPAGGATGSGSGGAGELHDDAEEVVRRITEQIMQQLKG